MPRMRGSHPLRAVSAGPTTRGLARSLDAAAHAVDQLEQLVCGELDLLVPPLRRAEVAGDDPRAVDAPEIAVDEGVPGLGLVVGAFGQPEMPFGVVLPGMLGEIGVLV